MARKRSGRAPRGSAGATNASRRLVVVAAFDVVNFSALVEADEERVLAAWRALRQAIDPMIAVPFLPDLVRQGCDDHVQALWRRLPKDVFWGALGERAPDVS